MHAYIDSLIPVKHEVRQSSRSKTTKKRTCSDSVSLTPDPYPPGPINKNLTDAIDPNKEASIEDALENIKSISRNPSTGKFKCPYPNCNYPGAKRRHNLKIHFLTHLGTLSKVFSCSICSRTFRRRFDCKRHVDTFHKCKMATDSAANAVIRLSDNGIVTSQSLTETGADQTTWSNGLAHIPEAPIRITPDTLPKNRSDDIQVISADKKAALNYIPASNTSSSTSKRPPAEQSSLRRRRSSRLSKS